MWSSRDVVDADKMKKYVDADTNKAFKKMRDIISAWRYHQDETTKGTLKKQSDRVAARFDVLESEIKAKNDKYGQIGLKDAWNSFMKARAAKAGAKVETFLDTWLKAMNDAWVDGNENSNPNAGNDPKSNPKGNDPNSKTSRLAKLTKERESMGKFPTPFDPSEEAASENSNT